MEIHGSRSSQKNDHSRHIISTQIFDTRGECAKILLILNAK